MRLTLRTLLAYMDGLLDNKDSQELGKKIEESKFATDLFHKMRDVMRRLRLAAPSVTERGANLDCNTVAEYLDNVLPPDRVPDFEEVCLKSDVHLAEVASAHQILTMVLGEPAEIDPDSRQRMYQLPGIAGRVDEERLAASEAATVLSGDGRGATAPTPPPAPVKVRPRPVVPEYLRDPPKKRRLLPAAAITFFLCAAIVLILWVTGQLEADKPVGHFLKTVQDKINGKPVAANDDKEGTGGPSAAPAHPAAQNSGSGQGSGAAADSATAAGSGAATKPIDTAAPPAANPPVANSGPSKDTAAAPNAAPAVPPTEPVIPPPLPMPAGPSLTSPNKNSSPPVASATGTPLPIKKVPEPAPNIVPAPATGPAISGPVPGAGAVPNGGTPDPTHLPPVGPNGKEVAMVPPGTVPPGTATKPTPPVVDDKAKVARFTSDGQDVLLKYEPRSGVWTRLLPEEFLTANETLLSLPSYRSKIDIFDVGATLELYNGTRVEILQGTPQSPPGVDVDYGRLVIRPLAQAGARLRVVVGPHTGTVTLANVESICGLEVTRVHEPGTDPEKVLSHALTKLYVARGGATWEENGKQPIHLNAPAEFLLDGGGSDAPSGPVDVPKWITSNTISDLDQRAAVSVSQALPAERSASLGLMELTEARQKEVRWLAARCLGYLGQSDPLTAALNDADYRSEWRDYFDQLKEAISRGPETAAGIRQSLEKRFGNDAAPLYRMLWGYTDKDLEGGDDARLVKDLDNEVLVFRVLAYENLIEITHKGLTYRPDLQAAKRQAAVLRWKQELKLGQIRSTPPPEAKSHTPAPAAPKPSAPKHAEPPSSQPDDAAPDGVKPTSDLEPLPSSGASHRQPRVVPEPEPPAERQRAVVPEP